jgi:small subunit ribosomal protein S17
MTNLVEKKLKRTLQGVVVSDKMLKTVTVLVERKVTHPVMGKIITKSKKYHADTSNLKVHTGDIVQIQECAPISKTKAWSVIKNIGLADKSK